MTAPYTDADLRAEAASCLNALAILPTVQDIQRSLPGTYVDSHRTDDGGATWDDLLDAAGVGTAVGEIHALIDGAADVSAWAITLGAAGLQPVADIGVRLTTGGHPIAVQIAIDPELTDAARDELIRELTTVITATASRVLGCTPVD